MGFADSQGNKGGFGCCCCRYYFGVRNKIERKKERLLHIYIVLFEEKGGKKKKKKKKSEVVGSWIQSQHLLVILKEYRGCGSHPQWWWWRGKRKVGNFCREEFWIVLFCFVHQQSEKIKKYIYI